MEAAGLVIGVVGLLSVCLDLVERIDVYKNYGLDSQTLITRFEAKKLRFKEWAKAVGVSNGSLTNTHNPRLDNPEVAQVVTPILQCLQEILQKSQAASDRWQIKRTGTDLEMYILPTAPDESKKPTKAVPKTVSKRDGFRWTVKGKAQFTALVETMASLVDQLYEIVPLEADIAVVLQKLQDHANLSQILLYQQEQFDILQEKFTRESMRKAKREVRDWLNITTIDERYEKCLSDHLDGTCGWLLQHPSYHDWLSEDSDTSRAKFLWVNGPAGHGKSVLSAWLIQHLKTSLDAKVAYFFSSNQVQTGGSLDGAIRSWLSQIIDVEDTIFDVVFQRMESGSKTQIASSKEIWSTFRAVIRATDDLIFVLDGLDEFSLTDNNRKNFIKSLKEAVDGTKTRCIIASRPEPDIESELNDDQSGSFKLYTCKLSGVELASDIRLFSENVVDTQLSKKSVALRRELAEAIAQKSEGMFLWIKLQQTQLRSGRSEKALRNTVDSMPSGLDQSYERNWVSIQNYAEDDRERALCILRWVTFAQRPLTIAEITEAVVVEADLKHGTFPTDDLPEEIDDDYIDGEIKQLCGSLIEIQTHEDQNSPSRRTVHAIHVTVQQYLATVLPIPGWIGIAVDAAKDRKEAQQASIANVCLRYLSYSDVWESEKLSAVVTGYALRLYAADCWFHHLNACKDHMVWVESVLNDFFAPSNPSFLSWAKIYESSWLSQKPRSNAQSEAQEEEYLKNVSDGVQTLWPGFYYATCLGYTCTMQFLHNLDSTDINLKTPFIFGTALQAACAGKRRAAFDLLLQLGAEVNSVAGYYGTALNAAVVQGQSEMVQILLKNGARLDLRSMSGSTPLLEACNGGYTDLVTSFLAAGADVNAKDDAGVGPLQAASIKGNEEIVALLLDNGADVSARDERGKTAVYDAACENHVSVLKTLIQREADISMPRTGGQTPLSAATINGHLEVVQLLIEHGADVSTPDDDGWTALGAAISYNRLDLVRYLLNHGAEITTHCPNGLPIHIAARSDNSDLVKELLKYGADASKPDADGWTPLCLAVSDSRIEVVKELIRGGADVSAQIELGWMPIHLAADEGRLDIVRELLDHGANVAASNKEGYTPLHAASSKGHLPIATELLDRGADLSAANADGWTPLHSASNNGHVRVVKELLRRGANVSTASATGWTALHFAADEGHLEVVKLLLSHDADVTAKTEDGWTALHLSAHDGRLDVIKELLSHGADPLAQTADNWSAIHYAVREGKLETVRELLDHVGSADISGTNIGTPLHIAAAFGHLDIAKELIHHGAEVEKESADNITPLIMAAFRGHRDVVAELFSRGARVNTVNVYGMTALHAAAAMGHLEITTDLISRGADLSFQTRTKQTALHFACARGWDQCSEALVNAGTDVSLIDVYGRTALDWVRVLGSDALKSKLLPGVSSPAEQANSQENTLRIRSTRSIAQQLLEKGDWVTGELGFEELGYCFMYMADYDRAIYALQQHTIQADKHGSAPSNNNCQLCDTTQVNGKRFVCKTCLEFDVCDNCMKDVSEQKINPACRGHSFLAIPEPPRETSAHPLAEDELKPEVRAWLEKVLKELPEDLEPHS